MNTNEKKIFFSVFIFNLLGFIAAIAIFIAIILTAFNYLADVFPMRHEQISLMSKFMVGVIIVLALTKIKSLYVNTKKTTLNYLDKVKDDYDR